MRRRILLNASSGGDDGRKTIGGYEVVDLGLSNGLLFATCNVGATKEEEYGNYYQYGKGDAQYTATSGDSDYSGTEDPLASSADTATQAMGSGWRMPTLDEFEDLINNTNYKWTTINRIDGGKFTSKTNPNAYVFFPAAGDYRATLGAKGLASYIWCSTFGDRAYGKLWSYYLHVSNGSNVTGSYFRNLGCSVRGVHAAV